MLYPREALRTDLGIALIFAATWLILGSLGREPLSSSGFGWWTGGWTKHTSQWIADPYSFTHVLHGVLFYALLYPLRDKLPLHTRFLLAVLIEAAWEVLENSSFILDRYRANTAALEYYGDSILNSTFDIVAAMLGFWLAHALPWRWTVAVVIVVELGLLVFIRDSLLLNVVMLLYPIEVVKQWQFGAAL
jgi:hypothetical protein